MTDIRSIAEKDVNGTTVTLDAAIEPGEVQFVVMVGGHVNHVTAPGNHEAFRSAYGAYRRLCRKVTA